jgi:hypothetical protein
MRDKIVSSILIAKMISKTSSPVMVDTFGLGGIANAVEALITTRKKDFHCTLYIVNSFLSKMLYKLHNNNVENFTFMRNFKS